MNYSARFYFSGSLNDFLSAKNKNTVINYPFSENPSVKDAIEAIGIPHTEVDIILVNGSAANFTYRLHDKDEVKVFPVENISSLTSGSLTPPFTYPIKFLADAHLGKLAKTLRIIGIDTFYQNEVSDKQVAEIGEKENRVVLTRDVALLKQKVIKHGYWLRNQHFEKQLQEVVTRFNLVTQIKPFTLCIECNGKIEPVAKESVIAFIPEKSARHFDEFYQCSNCKKFYWKGSHYEHMLQNLDRWLKADIK
jgi:hypothetical protein